MLRHTKNGLENMQIVRLIILLDTKKADQLNINLIV